MHSNHMVREGARLEVVRDNMGHANIDVTHDVYAKSAGCIAKFRCEERKGVGPPWDKDHKLAMAAAILTAKRLVE